MAQMLLDDADFSFNLSNYLDEYKQDISFKELEDFLTYENEMDPFGSYVLPGDIAQTGASNSSSNSSSEEDEKDVKFQFNFNDVYAASSENCGENANDVLLFSKQDAVPEEIVVEISPPSSVFSDDSSCFGNTTCFPTSDNYSEVVANDGHLSLSGCPVSVAKAIPNISVPVVKTIPVLPVTVPVGDSKIIMSSNGHSPRFSPTTVFKPVVPKTASPEPPVLHSPLISAADNDDLSKTKRRRSKKLSDVMSESENVARLFINADTADVSPEQLQYIKRQIRMIKNRESAILSRAKKKEYTESLERKVQSLEKENELLKMENSELKEKLKNCNCQNLRTNVFGDKKRKVTALLGVVLIMSLNAFNIATSYQKPEFESESLSVSVLDDSFHSSRSLLWAKDDSLPSEDNTSPQSSLWTNSTPQKCTMYINQTESLRLDSELRKWISGEVNKSRNVNISADNSKATSYKGRRLSSALFASLASMHRNNKYSMYTRRALSSLKIPRPNAESEMEQLFNMPDDSLFDNNEPLSEVMQRQKDTFYFVSFSGDHIILPATTRNSTFRPKMSLVLPTSSVNGSSSAGEITMMQIDCAVTDTRVLYVKEKYIPLHLRTGAFRKLRKSGANSSEYFSSWYPKHR